MEPAWISLHNHSHFSLQDGLSKPEDIASRMVECGFNAFALTDHGELAGIPSFIKAFGSTCKCGHNKRIHDSDGVCCKTGCECGKYENYPLKAIAGCEFYICKESSLIKERSNASLNHLCVLAKDQDGWNNLVKASSVSNESARYYYKPRLQLEELAAFSQGKFIVFSGHIGSDLANVCFGDNYKLAYNANTYDLAKSFVREDWREAVEKEMLRYQSLFGVGNFFVEIQLIDHENIPATLVIARILRYIAKKLGIPCVATVDAHYVRKEDAQDHRVILCAALNTNFREVHKKLDADQEVGFSAFFLSNKYYIPSQEEMLELHKDEPEELLNAVKIAAMCESPKLSHKPMIPDFPTPDGTSPAEYLTAQCEKGWKKKVEKKVKREKHDEYRARLTKELGVLHGAGLESYFLITQDFIDFARRVLKCLVGPGRGSAAGSLVAYLTDITRIDPIEFGLIFERFYNAGRNTKDRIALPDIDNDFPKGFRELVLEYVKQKYGADRVCQMATFGAMKGKSALKDVLRAHGQVDFETMNKMTEHIPAEDKISDALQEMIEETGEASIIRWSLENIPSFFKEWCWIGENDELEGPFALQFAQAIRLEGTKRTKGKHASGVIVCSMPLAEVVPMGLDKATGEPMVNVDMRDAEDMGLVKIDMLSIDLNSQQDAIRVMREGKL